MKNSGKITDYCYIHTLYRIQISAQSIHNNWSDWLFKKIFSSNNLAAHFLKTRNFTITNLKVITRLQMHQLAWFFFFKCSLQSPLLISAAFGKTNFPTLCTFLWMASHLYLKDGERTLEWWMKNGFSTTF